MVEVRVAWIPVPYKGGAVAGSVGSAVEAMEAMVLCKLWSQEMLTVKAEGITKSAMCFLFKHEDFELDLQNPNLKKKQCHTFVMLLSTRRQENPRD